jgi:hypothetical protein
MTQHPTAVIRCFASSSPHVSPRLNSRHILDQVRAPKVVAFKKTHILPHAPKFDQRAGRGCCSMTRASQLPNDRGNEGAAYNAAHLRRSNIFVTGARTWNQS